MEADESLRAREALRQFKRAGTALIAVAAFWLWLLLGSAEFISGIFESPKALVVAFYGGSVLVLVSLLVALTSIMVILANWPDKSQREEAYRTTRQRINDAAAAVLRQSGMMTSMVRSIGRPRPIGLSFHAIRVSSARLPGACVCFLAAAGRIAGSAAGWRRQAIGACRRIVARRMEAVQIKGVLEASARPLPSAENAPSQNPASIQARPMPARTPLPVRRPPVPSRPPASAAGLQSIQDRRDIAS